MVLIAYVDESGNTGDVGKGGSLTYSLGCVLLDSPSWPGAFNGLVDFRRRLRDKFGIPVRVELAPDARRIIYRAHMRLLKDLPSKPSRL